MKKIALVTFILIMIAAPLSSFADEGMWIGKPNEARYDEFRDSKLESLKFGLFSPAPIYPDMEETILGVMAHRR